MPGKQTVTEAELKNLILAGFNAEENKKSQLQSRLRQELGQEIQEEKPGVVAMKNKFLDWISDVLARRLKEDQRAIPLLTAQDVDPFTPTLISIIVKDEGDELGTEDHKMLEKFANSMFENIFETVQAMVPPDKNPYEEYWRWATTVTDLASEHDIPPTELLMLEWATDEITRRLLTKTQFRAVTERALNKLVDADAMKRMIVQPILDMVTSEFDEDDRREFEQEMEAELMPKLRKDIEKIRVVINAWLSEEINRIYMLA